MSRGKPKLLFITQKIHQDDDDLAFVILWIKEFIRQGVDVEVVCLEKGTFDNSFPVHSLGKETGLSRWARILRFYKLIFSLDYDRVFVHMNPEYITLGGWYWFLRGAPMYLWYTHYTMHVHLWLAGIFCERMFAATVQSLPQYEGNPKKVVTGHGIDVDFWTKNSQSSATVSGTAVAGISVSEVRLLSVHRICRSKRLEIGIESLQNLPGKSVDVIGRDVEKDYAREMRELVAKHSLGERVNFLGPRTPTELKTIFPNYRVMINMAMETIDKTMLEGMLFGLYPVTTPGNSRAIGLPVWPKGESPEDVASFIKSGEWAKFGKAELAKIVEEKHSLKALIAKMLVFIRVGN